jgi:hypothetical protein
MLTSKLPMVNGTTLKQLHKEILSPFDVNAVNVLL